MYNDVITDFAKRTMANLDFVHEQVLNGNESLFYVTQLWNSLLGLIVLPLETDKQDGGGRIPETPMAELRSQGWPRLTTEGGTDNETLRDLLWNLRHAAAHANVKFMPEGTERQIASVKLWNIKGGKRVWEGKATVDELARFVRLLAAEYQGSFERAA